MKLRIGPHVWRVEWKRGDDVVGDEIPHGQTNKPHLAIYVCRQQALTQQQETLLHEALHACTHVAGIDNELDPAQEEGIVNRLAPVLLGALRDNPKLVAFLTKKEK